MTTDEPNDDSQSGSAADEFDAAMRDWQNGLQENALQRLLNARDLFREAEEINAVVMCGERIGMLLFELGDIRIHLRSSHGFGTSIWRSASPSRQRERMVILLTFIVAWEIFLALFA